MPELTPKTRIFPMGSGRNEFHSNYANKFHQHFQVFDMNFKICFPFGIVSNDLFWEAILNSLTEFYNAIQIACVASVPVQSERNSGRKQKKWKEGGGGEERRERLPANPRILKNAHWFSRLSSFTD